MDQGVNDVVYYPMLVSMRGTAEDLSNEEYTSVWKRYLALDKSQRDIITSHELSEKLREWEKRFQLQSNGIGYVSLIIRKMFFEELDVNSAVAAIQLEFSNTKSGDPAHAKAIIEAIQREVFTIKPAPEPEILDEVFVASRPTAKTVKLPLLKAMSEYKHLSEQMLTEEKIKLKGSTEPVRPSLGNWLKSYREELGIGFHETAQRGGFLFQSQNGKCLSNEERARLNLILKSVEENFPLDIDTEHQTIVFPQSGDASMELTQVKTRPIAPIILPRSGIAPAPTALSQPTTPAAQSFFSRPTPEKNVSGETLHFSTGHVLPAEREAPARDGNEALRQMQHPTSNIKREIKAPLAKSPYSIRPLRMRGDDTNDTV